MQWNYKITGIIILVIGLFLFYMVITERFHINNENEATRTWICSNLEIAIDEDDSLTEDELLTYASTPFYELQLVPITFYLFSYKYRDKSYGITHFYCELGRLDGEPVIAEFICGDVCPSLTSRIIRYDSLEASSCDNVGGVRKPITVTRSIASSDEIYCFPRVLADNWGKYQKHIPYESPEHRQLSEKEACALFVIQQLDSGLVLLEESLDTWEACLNMNN
jgi:hypothetical protein